MLTQAAWEFLPESPHRPCPVGPDSHRPLSGFSCCLHQQRDKLIVAAQRAVGMIGELLLWFFFSKQNSVSPLVKWLFPEQFLGMVALKRKMRSWLQGKSGKAPTSGFSIRAIEAQSAAPLSAPEASWMRKVFPHFNFFFLQLKRIPKHETMCFLHTNPTSMNTLLWENRLEFLCSYFLWARPIDFSIPAPQTFQHITRITLGKHCGWWWGFIYLFSIWGEPTFVVCVYSFNCGSINSPPSQPHCLHVCRRES